MSNQILNSLLIGLLLSSIAHHAVALTSCYYGDSSYKSVTCYTGDNVFCQKQVTTYQGSTSIARTCETTCIDDITGTVDGGSVTKTYCCTNDNCNYSSKISSCLFLTSVMIGLTLILFKSN